MSRLSGPSPSSMSPSPLSPSPMSSPSPGPWYQCTPLLAKSAVSGEPPTVLPTVLPSPSPDSMHDWDSDAVFGVGAGVEWSDLVSARTPASGEVSAGPSHRCTRVGFVGTPASPEAPLHPLPRPFTAPAPTSSKTTAGAPAFPRNCSFSDLARADAPASSHGRGRRRSKSEGAVLRRAGAGGSVTDSPPFDELLEHFRLMAFMVRVRVGQCDSVYVFADGFVHSACFPSRPP
jgi:hypothetical protein